MNMDISLKVSPRCRNQLWKDHLSSYNKELSMLKVHRGIKKEATELAVVNCAQTWIAKGGYFVDSSGKEVNLDGVYKMVKQALSHNRRLLVYELNNRKVPPLEKPKMNPLGLVVQTKLEARPGCHNMLWQDHLTKYNSILSNITGSGKGLRTRATVQKCIKEWFLLGGYFLNKNGSDLEDCVPFVKKALFYNKEMKNRQTRGRKKKEQVQLVMKKIFRESTNKRKVVGRNIMYIELSNGSIVKHEMKVRTTIFQLRTEYSIKGLEIQSAFVVNPNIATTFNKKICPDNQMPVFILKHKDQYRIGVVKKCDSDHCNLDFVDLLLWNGDIDSFSKRLDWDLNASWTEFQFPSSKLQVDRGFVNQVIGCNVLKRKDNEIIYLHDSLDFCPCPDIHDSLVIYCRKPTSDTICNNPLHGNIGKTNQSLISIPIGYPEDYERRVKSSTLSDSWERVQNDKNGSFHFRLFVEVTLKDLVAVSETQHGVPDHIFHKSLIRIAESEGRIPFTRLIPNMDQPTRLVLVDDKEFAILCKPETSVQIRLSSRGFHFEYIVSKEDVPANATRSPGVCLAAIEQVSSIRSATDTLGMGLSYDNARTIPNVLGRDGHKRKCADHGGHHSVRGCCRATGRPNPNPAVREEDVAFQAYYDQKMKNHFGLFGVEYALRYLEEHAMVSGDRMQPALLSIPEHEQADRRIVTCGLSSDWKKAVPFLGFVNGEHIDVNDFKDREDFLQWVRQSPYGEYMMRVLELVDCGIVTTCQYRHLWKNGYGDNDDYTVNAYFMHHGIGIAHPLHDCWCMSILAYAYSHCTSFCYLVNNRNRKVVLQNKKDMFNMFAWGTGGNTNRRRCRYIAIGGDPTTRVTQRCMDEFLTQAVEEAENQEEADINPVLQAYIAMDADQQMGFSQGEELGEDNQEDPSNESAVAEDE